MHNSKTKHWIGFLFSHKLGSNYGSVLADGLDLDPSWCVIKHHLLGNVTIVIDL